MVALGPPEGEREGMEEIVLRPEGEEGQGEEGEEGEPCPP